MPEPDTIVSLSGVRKSFGSRVAVDGIDLSLDTGRFYGLVGPNGAGKTTLIRMVTGRIRPDKGRVSVAGGDPATDRGVLSRIGLVPQEIALYDELTSRENLELFGRLAGLSRGRARAATAAALEWIGLADRASSRTDQLSGGMKRRLNIAAGTLHEPRLLLLDEPSVGIDPRARELVHDLLRDLRARGVTILLTTHDLSEAEMLCEEVIIVDEGRIRASGTPAELVARHGPGGPELTVELEHSPDDGARGVLRQLGLEPRAEDGETRWSGQIERAAALPALWDALDRAGIEVREARIRPADLRSVFLAVTGKEIEP